jgi:hypothetical protein
MADLERRLADAAASYRFPPTPDLATAARSRLPGRRSRRRLVLALAAALVAAAVAVAASPGARSAIRDLLDAIPGVSVERLPELPPGSYVLLPDYGERVGLERAQAAAGFPLRLPDGLGEPDAVHLDRDRAGAPVVTAVWGADTGPRLVLTQWRARSILFHKSLGPRSQARLVRLDGSDALWLAGDDHAVFYDGGGPDDERRAAYLAGNALAWTEAGVTYRLEGRFTLDEARRLAESL